MFIVYHAQLMEIFATYSRCANPSLFVGFLACHTYCDTSIYNGHVRGPMTHIYYRALGSEPVTICFNNLHVGQSQLGFENLIFRLWGECSNGLRHRSGAIRLQRNLTFKENIYCISTTFGSCRFSSIQSRQSLTGTSTTLTGNFELSCSCVLFS